MSRHEMLFIKPVYSLKCICVSRFHWYNFFFFLSADCVVSVVSRCYRFPHKPHCRRRFPGDCVGIYSVRRCLRFRNTLWQQFVSWEWPCAALHQEMSPQVMTDQCVSSQERKRAAALRAKHSPTSQKSHRNSVNILNITQHELLQGALKGDGLGLDMFYNPHFNNVHRAMSNKYRPALHVFCCSVSTCQGRCSCDTGWYSTIPTRSISPPCNMHHIKTKWNANINNVFYCF